MINTTECRACRAPIFFIKTQKGTCIPVDAESVIFKPDPAGSATFVLMDGSTQRGLKVSEQGEDTKIGYISHFATCTEADSFRKRRKSDRKKG